MSTREEIRAATDEYWDYYSSVDIRKKYSCVAGQNTLVSEETYETNNDGTRLKQTYTDKQGYTFTAYKKGNKVTCITINKPNGDEKSQVTITRNQLDLDDYSSSQQKKVMKNLPEQVAKGASISEIYQNFQDYLCASIPKTDRPKEEYLAIQEKHKKEQIAMNTYFTDADYFIYTEQERQDIAANMKAASEVSHSLQKFITQKLETENAEMEKSLKEATKKPMTVMTNDRDTSQR